jgi:hypothetical protein
VVFKYRNLGKTKQKIIYKRSVVDLGVMDCRVEKEREREKMN